MEFIGRPARPPPRQNGEIDLFDVGERLGGDFELPAAGDREGSHHLRVGNRDRLSSEDLSLLDRFRNGEAEGGVPLADRRNEIDPGRIDRHLATPFRQRRFLDARHLHVGEQGRFVRFGFVLDAAGEESVEQAGQLWDEGRARGGPSRAKMSVEGLLPFLPGCDQPLVGGARKEFVHEINPLAKVNERRGRDPSDDFDLAPVARPVQRQDIARGIDRHDFAPPIDEGASAGSSRRRRRVRDQETLLGRNVNDAEIIGHADQVAELHGRNRVVDRRSAEGKLLHRVTDESERFARLGPVQRLGVGHLKGRRQGRRILDMDQRDVEGIAEAGDALISDGAGLLDRLELRPEFVPGVVARMDLDSVDRQDLIAGHRAWITIREPLLAFSSSWNSSAMCALVASSPFC